jgi:hypothetical protein
VDGSGVAVGGIFRLGREVVAHRTELYADFRHLYSTSVEAVSGRELFHLLLGLLGDPSSRWQAAVHEWEYPITREGMNTLHLMDLLIRRWTPAKQSPRLWPRPWDAVELRARARRISDERLLRVLRPGRYSAGDGEQVDPEGDG